MSKFWFASALLKYEEKRKVFYRSGKMVTAFGSLMAFPKGSVPLINSAHPFSALACA